MMKSKMPPKGMGRPAPAKGTMGRTLKMLVKSYPVLFPLAIACIIFSAITAAIPATFTQRIIAIIEQW